MQEVRKIHTRRTSLTVCGIVRESIVDGPGLRYVVFVQGCPHRCEGCHNPQTHDFGAGRTMDIYDIFTEMQRNPLLSGITFSGGEPFCQAEPLCALAELVLGAGKTVVTYTGYLWEELREDPVHAALLARTDILIDGKYEAGMKDHRLKFRGSANQRLIDLGKKRRLERGAFGIG